MCECVYAFVRVCVSLETLADEAVTNNPAQQTDEINIIFGLSDSRSLSLPLNKTGLTEEREIEK